MVLTSSHCCITQNRHWHRLWLGRRPVARSRLQRHADRDHHHPNVSLHGLLCGEYDYVDGSGAVCSGCPASQFLFGLLQVGCITQRILTVNRPPCLVRHPPLWKSGSIFYYPVQLCTNTRLSSLGACMANSVYRFRYCGFAIVC